MSALHDLMMKIPEHTHVYRRGRGHQRGQKEEETFPDYFCAEDGQGGEGQQQLPHMNSFLSIASNGGVEKGISQGDGTQHEGTHESAQAQWERNNSEMQAQIEEKIRKYCHETEVSGQSGAGQSGQAHESAHQLDFPPHRTLFEIAKPILCGVFGVWLPVYIGLNRWVNARYPFKAGGEKALKKWSWKRIHDLRLNISEDLLDILHAAFCTMCSLTCIRALVDDPFFGFSVLKNKIKQRMNTPQNEALNGVNMNSITCSASTTAPSGASSDGEGCENASTNRGNTSTNGEQIGQNKQTGSSAAEEPEKSANKSTNNNKKLSITRFCDAFLYMSTAFFMADFIHMTKELIVRGKMPHQGLERVVHHLIQCTANIPTLLTGGPAGLVMRSYLTQGYLAEVSDVFLRINNILRRKISSKSNAKIKVSLYAKYIKLNYVLLLSSFFFSRIWNFYFCLQKVLAGQKFLSPKIAKIHLVGSWSAILLNAAWFLKLSMTFQKLLIKGIGGRKLL